MKPKVKVVCVGCQDGRMPCFMIQCKKCECKKGKGRDLEKIKYVVDDKGGVILEGV